MPDSTDKPELTDYLPDWLADFATDNAHELRVPVDAAALLGLGAVAAAVNGGANTMPIPSWKEPVCLYTLALLASGEGKSPLFTRLMEPVMAASDEITDSKVGDVLAQKARRRMTRKFLRSYEADQMKLVKKGEKSFDEASADVAEMERTMNRQNRASNTIPIRVLTDTTSSGLLDALEANDGRVTVASPEAEALLNFQGGAKNAVLQGFDGELLRQTRRVTGEITIERPTVNMVIAMQPTVLGSLGSGLVNRGVMPRFLMVVPESMVGKRQARTALVSDEVVEAYEENIRKIVERFVKAGEPTDILWDAEARREVGNWRIETEPMLLPDGPLGAITAWGSKVQGAHFIRLAALQAIMHGRTTVTKEDALNAQGILRLLIEHAKRAFSEMGASFAADDLVYLMGIVAKLDPSKPFAKRDIMRRSNRFMGGPERCTDALQRAVDEGLLEVHGRGWQVPK